MIIKQGHTSASHQVLQGEAGSLRQGILSTLGAHNLTDSQYVYLIRDYQLQ